MRNIPEQPMPSWPPPASLSFDSEFDDAYLRVKSVLPVAILWVMLAVNNWRHFYPYSEALFFLTLAATALFQPRSAPIIAIMPFFAPLTFILPHPYFICFGVLVVTGFLRGCFISPDRLVTASLVWSAMLFLLYCAISILLRGDVVGVTGYLADVMEGVVFLLLVLALLNHPGAVVTIIKAIAALAALAFFISLVSSLWRDQMWATQYYTEGANGLGAGWTAKYSVMYGNKVLGERIIPAGFEPNYWGACLQFPLWLAVGLAGASRRPTQRLLWMGASVLIILGILGTFSRSSFLTVLGVGMLFGARRRMRGVMLLGLLGASGLALVWLNPLMADRLWGIEESISYGGGSGRIGLWAGAIELWFESPTWGQGLGSFVQVFGLAVHNTYLQLLTELGLIGLGIYLTPIYIGLRSWWRLAGLAKICSDEQLGWLAEGGFLGAIATYLNIASITCYDVKFVWLPAAVGFALYMHLRMQTATPDPRFGAIRHPVPPGATDWPPFRDGGGT